MKFPPPEYLWNGVSGDAVLQQVKVKRERPVAEKRMEERRMEEEELEEGEIRESKCTDDHHKHEKMMKKVEFDHGECENQSLESSSLTEELQQPVFDSLYDTSDSTKDIKQKKEHCCCFITRIDHSDYLHSSLERTNYKANADWKDETASTFMSSKTWLHHLELQYRELIVNFIPPPIRIEHPEFDDQEQLLERNLSRSSTTESSISNASNDDDLPYGRYSLYPCAQYLIQADISPLYHIQHYSKSL